MSFWWVVVDFGQTQVGACLDHNFMSATITEKNVLVGILSGRGHRYYLLLFFSADMTELIESILWQVWLGKVMNLAFQKMWPLGSNLYHDWIFKICYNLG